MPVQELVRSSAIERVAYDQRERRLTVWFIGGRRYVYSEVPRTVYEALCAAESAGTYLNASIKGRYPCVAMPPRRRYPA